MRVDKASIEARREVMQLQLMQLHLDGGGTLLTTAGEVVRQGEDLGRWVTSVRLGWDQLSGVQICEQVRRITPAAEDEKPKPR
ncbi:hypothetical protein [Streptomyces sp. NPDC058623]|uniref:hypothetical protein n=1 Tax=Streptomyces sp. NPDC058623 TaxID=3346563 RepID=UPI00366812BD